MENQQDLTPIRNPLFGFQRKSERSPTQYLDSHQVPFGKKAAQWQKEFFNLPELPQYREEVEIAPTRPSAPTFVALFYFDTQTRRPVDLYLRRIENLAKMNEQTINYVPPDFSHKIKAMHSDKKWHVIDDYKTIWDMPNNAYQRENFGHTQHRIFKEFDGYSKSNDWHPNSQYDRPHLSAVYNAKAFVSYDAVMRNPFGSDRWIYVDAGIWHEGGPRDAKGVEWGDVMKERLDESKFDRATSISGDTGIVIGEYMQSHEHGVKDINHECWDDPKKAWLCLHFIAHAYVGSSLGMLNYSVRYMQTVDDLDANQRYSGRKECLIPWVAIRYPNTVFSIPWVRTPWLRAKWECPMKSCFTTYGGSGSVPAIVDPISTIFCKGYQPRRPNLAGKGLYERKLLIMHK